jgi:arylsulfatase
MAGKPNILIIWGDDIGYWNISAYGKGMMGYKTPNIDRIANEGMTFHRLLRGAKLHGWARGVHYGSKCFSLRTQ